MLAILILTTSVVTNKAQTNQRKKILLVIVIVSNLDFCFYSTGNLDLVGSRQVFRGENNPWVTPIADQFQVGVSHVFEYIRSETYKL